MLRAFMGPRWAERRPREMKARLARANTVWSGAVLAAAPETGGTETLKPSPPGAVDDRQSR